MVHGVKIKRENMRFAMTGFAVGYFPHLRYRRPGVFSRANQFRLTNPRRHRRWSPRIQATLLDCDRRSVDL